MYGASRRPTTTTAIPKTRTRRCSPLSYTPNPPPRPTNEPCRPSLAALPPPNARAADSTAHFRPTKPDPALPEQFSATTDGGRPASIPRNDPKTAYNCSSVAYNCSSVACNCSSVACNCSSVACNCSSGRLQLLFRRLQLLFPRLQLLFRRAGNSDVLPGRAGVTARIGVVRVNCGRGRQE
jgi:hypothetical protein